MRLSSIVTVVLRLFAVAWFVQGAVMFFAVAASRVPLPTPGFGSYFAPVVLLVVAVLVFVLSGLLGRLVTPPPNAEVPLGGLTLYDLYCFAFVFLGLYFVLSSFGSVINWLHYFLVTGRLTEASDSQGPGFYQLTESLLKLVAGGAALLFAPRWARKLAGVQGKLEGRAGEPPHASP